MPYLPYLAFLNVSSLSSLSFSFIFMFKYSSSPARHFNLVRKALKVIIILNGSVGKLTGPPWKINPPHEFLGKNLVKPPSMFPEK
jgi:hypothetical protein